VWPMPKSKEGCYAVFVDDKDQVWVSDWGANAIHRFDPVTQQFASFPSNRARSDVRQILGRPGELWAAESGTDRLILIKP
jgi:virginiamycin B lyase